MRRGPEMFEGLQYPLPLPSKDSYFKAFGPEDPIISGFWATLMLRVS